VHVSVLVVQLGVKLEPMQVQVLLSALELMPVLVLVLVLVPA
jgi:hypothetical protein